MLECKALQVRYGYVEALKGIDLLVKENSITSLLGANGAGKSTTLRAISGLEKVYRGEILFEGKRLDVLQTHEIVALGIVQCPEGRKLFPGLSVHENLLAGGYPLSSKQQLTTNLEFVTALFPVLAERKKQAAGTLSGGEQQMLAIARALMADPKLLMLDEPSLGLAPIIVEQIFDVLLDLKKAGKTIFLVEQNANAALHISDQAYILEVGQVVLSGSGKELLANGEVKAKYLGG
ncbi:MAG TPA: ABC transporter ATP-binding protein [Thermotogota bacterium]|nr:ABC transporter ATP-binding protein [Thermotogota bacterium]HRW92587.1 ABC transporter ATP-binding protein [Thermotogota bacterium]